MPTGSASAPTAIDPAAAFGSTITDLWLEIGFGAGEHLAAQAAAHPEIGLIGCEPYVNGVAALLSRIDAVGLTNIRIVADDARPLLAALPAACLGRVFILFPDPWPKRRHHKRRLISTRALAELARVMKDDAELRLATDHREYARWMLRHLLADPDFFWTARCPRDWREAPPDWPETRYQIKAAAAGRPAMFLRFRRRVRGRPAENRRPRA